MPFVEQTPVGTRTGSLLGRPSTPDAAVTDGEFSLLDVREQCAAIRRHVCDAHVSGGLLYLTSGPLLRRNGSDVFYRFRADSDFLYVTGINEPDFGCLLDLESGSLTLLAPEVPEAAALWWGGLPSTDELAQQHGAAKCVYVRDLGALLLEEHPGRVVHTTEALMEGLLHDTRLAPTQVTSSFAPGLLARCRSRKTRGEVACLQRASVASAAGHRAIWRHCRPGVHEYQLEAQFVAACMHQGCLHQGYPAIVGSGPNAAVLHYERNTRRACAGEVVLVDAGSEYRGYTADISRTCPVSDTFSAAQRDVYDLVLLLQERALSLISPGVLWRDLDHVVRVLLLDRLQDLGLLRNTSTAAALAARVDRVFLPHGLGHFLGLDVHDVSEDGPVPVKLAQGHVVTVEPGLYFSAHLLERALATPQQRAMLNEERLASFANVGGVRIEDNVLVLESGALNLTEAAGLPKAAADVEAAKGILF